MSRADLGKSEKNVPLKKFAFLVHPRISTIIEDFIKSVFLLFNFRFFIYLLINFSVWPLIRGLVQRKKLFKFIFLVYPGTLQEVNHYGPPWFRPYTRFISIIGTIWSKDERRRGLVVTIPFVLEEFHEFSNEKILLERIFNSIKEFSRSIGTLVIALAGRLPSLFLKHSLPVEYPFVKGDKGSIFTIIEAVRNVINRERLSIPKTTVGVVGVGFIGRSVLCELQKMGFYSIIGIDSDFQKISTQEISGVRLTTNFEFLSTCDLVLLLTTRGEDIEQKTSWLKSKVIIIDDTYPPIPKSLRKLIIQAKQAKIYRAIIELPGVKFRPSLPGFASNWLPGCVIEALIVSSNSNFNFSTQEEFNLKAREVGFKPILITLE